jgi:hypothetical protein
MIAIIWILAAIGLALWSLVSWALHAVLVRLPEWSSDPGSVISAIPFAEWLDRWVPGWDTLVRIALDMAVVALAWVGSYAPLVVWLVWGLGAALVFGTAGVLTLIVVLLRPKANRAVAAG